MNYDSVRSTRLERLVLAVLLFGISTTLAHAAGRSKHLDYAPKPGFSLAQPPRDKAVVIFLRPKKTGQGIHASVFDGEEFISFAMVNGLVVYHADPGEHRFMVVSEAADFLQASLEAGRIYFIEVAPRWGAWKARFSLLALPPESEDWKKLRKWVSKAYVTEPRESARTWAVENRPSVLAKKEAYLPKWEQKAEGERPTLRETDGVTEF